MEVQDMNNSKDKGMRQKQLYRVMRRYKGIQRYRDETRTQSEIELLKEDDELKWKCDEEKGQWLTRLCGKSHSQWACLSAWCGLSSSPILKEICFALSCPGSQMDWWHCTFCRCRGGGLRRSWYTGASMLRSCRCMSVKKNIRIVKQKHRNSTSLWGIPAQS